MKPKISTGVIASPSRKQKTKAPNTESFQFNEEVYEKIISDPIKRQLILQLIHQEKDAIEEYKRNEKKKKLQAHRSSPVNKVKRNVICESPTALLRRRALEQLNRGNESDSSSESNVNSASSNASPCASPVLFEKLLHGVVAFVEVKSKDQDRSGGAKALMRAMGAKVRDVFTKDVTHVIFKDGSFSTYQKAKLMQVKLVSVLWLEAVRKNGYRVPEKEYPAFGAGTYNNDISVVCSQFQKEYEDVIREEVRRSLISGTPLPSTKIHRRRTLASPLISAKQTAEIFSQSSHDLEVDNINRSAIIAASIHRPPSTILENLSPELTSDDDSETGLIDGRKCKEKNSQLDFDIIDETISDNLLSHFKNKKSLNCSDMELTMLDKKTNNRCLKEITVNNSDMQLRNIRSFKRQSEVPSSSKNSPKDIYRRKTVLLEEIKFTNSSDKSTNISDENHPMVDLHTSSINDIEILSKNCSSPSQAPFKNGSKCTTSSSMSALQLSTEKNSGSTKTDMSALRMSSENEVFKLDSTSSNMSSLKLTKESLKLHDTDNVTSPMNQIEKVLNAKNLPDQSKATNKHNSVGNSTGPSNRSFNLNETSSSSEIISSRYSTRKSYVSKESFSSIDISNALNILEDNITKRSRSRQSTNSSRKLSDKSREFSNNKSFQKELQTKENDATTIIKSKETNLRRSVRTNKEDDKINSLEQMNIDRSEDDDSEIANTNKDELQEKTNILGNVIILDDSIIKPSSRQSKKSLKRLSDESKEVPDNKKVKTITTNIDKAPEEKLKEKKNLQKLLHETNNDGKKSETNNPKEQNRRKSVRLKTKAMTKADSFEETNVDKSEVKDSEIDSSSQTNKQVLKENAISPNEPKEQKRQKVTRKQKVVKKITNSPAKIQVGVSETEESDESPNKTKRRLRKLYNPNESITVRRSFNDEKERKEKRLLVKRRNTGVFLKTSNTKSNESSNEDSSILLEVSPKTTNTKQCDKVDKKSYNNEDDEQKQLASEFIRQTPQIEKKANNSNDDEGKQLAAELNLQTPQPSKKIITSKSTGDKKLPTRKSIRAVRPPPKLNNFDLSICTPSNNRRSTLEFQRRSIRTTKKIKIDQGKKPSIVCTKMHSGEVILFTEVVKTLGRFRTEDNVSKKTTHLLAGEPKRTVNMLKAIAQGCWILKKQWLFDSMDARKWLPEEDYEETSFSPAVQQSRLQRQAFGPTYTMDIFENSGNIYIAKTTTPRCAELKELVKLCKGKLAHNPESADVIVGEFKKQCNTTCVTELWILDSVTVNKVKSLKKYSLHDPRIKSPCV